VIHPITLTQVGRILVEDYKVPPKTAYAEARKLLDRLEARGLQVIRGEWTQPEVVVIHDGPKTPPTVDDRWMSLANKVTRDTMDRTPWDSPELK
jgi:hypothetical protein